MRKIPTLFRRGPDGLVTGEVRKGCEWAWNPLAGVRATVKYDGLCCYIDEAGGLHRRMRQGRGQSIPGWRHWTWDSTRTEGFGWVPVSDAPVDRYHREALEHDASGLLPWGQSCELVGPRINGNPYGLDRHELWEHGRQTIESFGADFRTVLRLVPGIEGLVFWHPDGRRAKIKRKDFGLPWPTEESRSRRWAS